jgi:hypothetical protein
VAAGQRERAVTRRRSCSVEEASLTTISVPATMTFPAPVTITASNPTEIRRMARRAKRGPSPTSGLVTQRMCDARDELVAALRGDAAAIESLSVESDDPGNAAYATLENTVSSDGPSAGQCENHHAGTAGG